MKKSRLTGSLHNDWSPKYTTPRKGHAANHGTGPDGEKCSACKHIIKNGSCRKALFKCGLTDYTNGPGTDIRAKDPACRMWDPAILIGAAAKVKT